MTKQIITSSVTSTIENKNIMKQTPTSVNKNIQKGTIIRQARIK